MVEVPRLADLVGLDDSALIRWRRETLAELERHPSEDLQAVYDQTTREVAARAGGKWGQAVRGRPEWLTGTASADLLAGYRAARQLQVLVVPSALSKQVANYLLVVSAELAGRGVLDPEAAQP
jgi:RES domain-containing protein